MNSGNDCVKSDADAAGSLSRRNFVKTAAAGAIAVGTGSQDWAAETNNGEMIYRTLCKTGEKVSAIGLGGFHIGNPPEAEGIHIIRSAIGNPAWIG
jgi:uncharacterized protein